MANSTVSARTASGWARDSARMRRIRPQARAVPGRAPEEVPCLAPSSVANRPRPSPVCAQEVPGDRLLTRAGANLFCRHRGGVSADVRFTSQSMGGFRNMATRVRPLQDRVIIKRVEEREEKSVGGIIIPDTAKEKPQEGLVVAVGPGRREDGKVVAPDVKKGDRVLFGKYTGSEIKLDGEEHLILREEDLLGVVEA